MPEWICKKCDFDLVEIEIETIKMIAKELNPSFNSLSKGWKIRKKGWVKICPQCDAYALGIDTIDGFPFRTKDNKMKTIHDIHS